MNDVWKDVLTVELPQEIKTISRRDYFAAMAMQGRIAKGTFNYYEDVVKQSVMFADMLIAELDKKDRAE